jgi:hypothetical protein
LHGAERLLYWLYAEEHTFVFHVDQKAPEAAIFYLRQKYGVRRQLNYFNVFAVVQCSVKMESQTPSAVGLIGYFSSGG